MCWWPGAPYSALTSGKPKSILNACRRINAAGGLLRMAPLSSAHAGIIRGIGTPNGIPQTILERILVATVIIGMVVNRPTSIQPKEGMHIPNSFFIVKPRGTKTGRTHG